MHQSNIINDGDYDNDDFISFQLDSNKINLHYSQLTKYSKLIRDRYLFSDVIDFLPTELQKYQEQFGITISNLVLFFQLLQQNYNIEEDITLTYNECKDLLKMSKYFEVRKLSYQISEYIKRHNFEVDFIIQMIQYDIQTSEENENSLIGDNNELEKLLSMKIEECLSNEKFIELPVSIIHRILKASSIKPNIVNKLFDIIKKSISKFCVLLEFLEIQQLSDDRLDELIKIYNESDEISRGYFIYMGCNFELINKMRERLNSSEIFNKQIQKQLEETEKIKNEHENKLIELEKEKNQLKKRLKESQMIKIQDDEEKSQIKKQLEETDKTKNEQANQLIELEKEKKQLKKQLKESQIIKIQDDEEKCQIKKQLEETDKTKNEQTNQLKALETKFIHLQKQLNETERSKQEIEKEKIVIQKQLKSSNEAKNELQKRLEDEISPVKGEIVVTVKNGNLISARINLIMKKSALDTSKSKYIISTSDAKTVGNESYKNGQPITSLKMDTIDFICKAGTYYVRFLVFNQEGRSVELVSNSVKTNGSSVLFGYEGKIRHVSLFRGKYKLEVWGAKGGDSEGSRLQGLPGKGGLGGYSIGTLTLKENEIVHVIVGGEGCPSNESEGLATSGGFPDGGGTKTGHFLKYTSVPGTGGGSTSIRIKSDNEYGRIIVAGGGGGASGSIGNKDDGGFGGGLSGGNSYYHGFLPSQGSGTQTGSSGGRGGTSDGDPGRFGQRSDGKYSPDCESGGGGGGGWYGGGSGGCGRYGNASSGGGGSGWTFTEQNFKKWQSGDPTNASKFIPNSSLYLTDSMTIEGNQEFVRPDGKGMEKGHSGNGFAKITPE